MARFTKVLRILLIISLLLALLIVYGWSRLQDIKHDLGLTIDWQSLQLGINGVTFKELTISQQSSNGTLITTNSQDVILSFSTLTIKQLHIKIQQGDYIINEVEKATPLDLQNLLDNISWAPKKIFINQLAMFFPCSLEQCSVTGAVQILQNQPSDHPLSVLINIYKDEEQLDIKGDLYQKNQQLCLALTANFNKEPLLALNTQIDQQRLDNWQGTFNLYKINETQRLFVFLHNWLPNQQVTTEIPQAAEINADWQLYFPQGITVFKPEKGHFNINTSLPNPWPIIKLGYLQGLLTTQVSIANYRPRIEKLNADLTLTNLSPTLLANIPKDFQPTSINLKLNPLDVGDQLADRAISLYLNSKGALNTTFSTQAFINTSKAEITLRDGVLQANTKQLSLMDYQLQNARLSLPFTALITTKQATIEFDNSTLFTIQQLTSKEVSAKNLQLAAKRLTTVFNYQDKNKPELLITSPITLTTTALTQSLLHPVSWKLTGQLTTDLIQTRFVGKVSNGVDLSADLTLVTDYKQSMSIKAKTPDLFFRTSNIFSKTFKDWPEVLEIASGKTNINGSLNIPLDNKPLSVNATIKVTGLAGIYDRSEFRDLSGTATIKLDNNNLKITLPDLALTEANPGFNMGPFQFEGEYKAEVNRPTQGILSWSKAEASLFTGEVWLKPGQLNLATLPQEVDIQIKNLQLNDILNAYPTEGLNGEGAIDGNLPIIITNKGIDVKEGKLSARKEGYIKFNSPTIRAVGENNPNMKLVTGALENFQYTVLSSQISYNQGTAILGLQIKGRNPDIKDGQPINLNITLQEDIPALMTTLQLSDRVSETIQKRVQKRLQQSSSKK